MNKCVQKMYVDRFCLSVGTWGCSVVESVKRLVLLKLTKNECYTVTERFSSVRIKLVS